jgi:hypothetical protein
MIDDGKHDPPEIKIENLPWSIAQFDLWEHELRAKPKPTRRKRKSLTALLWGIVESVGHAYAHTYDFRDGVE